MYTEKWEHRLASTSISYVDDIRHRHLLFQYRKKICQTENCHSDIRRVPILTSESIPISIIQKIFITSIEFEPKTLVFTGERLISQPLCYLRNIWMSDIRYRIYLRNIWMSDIRYRIKVYSDIRYNVGLRSLQSDIGSSDIKLSPISLITDIRVSAPLWLRICGMYLFIYWE